MLTQFQQQFRQEFEIKSAAYVKETEGKSGMAWGNEENKGPPKEEQVLDEIVQAGIEDEYLNLTDVIMRQNIFESGIQFVFALLTKQSFALYPDMHMQ